MDFCDVRMGSEVIAIVHVTMIAMSLFSEGLNGGVANTVHG